MHASTGVQKTPTRFQPTPETKPASGRTLVLLALLGYVTVGLYAPHYGFSILTWDDSEYVKHALDIVDHVSNGPHYGKPPLYVDALALVTTLIGRPRIMLAAGLLAVATSTLLGWIVFRMLRPITGAWFAALSMLAVAGLPGLARWAPAPYPDVMLTACALAAIAVLASGREDTWTGVWLGLALGLGLLAKVTFLALAGFPLLYWFLQLPRRRSKPLAIACAIGGSIAGTWYLPNWRALVEYTAFSYHFGWRETASRAELVWEWLTVALSHGFSWALLLTGFTAATLITFHRQRTDSPPFPKQLVILSLLGALPVVLISLTSPDVAFRYLLPSSVILAVALLAVIWWVAETNPPGAGVLRLLSLTLILQWALVQAVNLPAVADALRRSPLVKPVALLVPGVQEMDPAPFDSVDKIISRAEAFGTKGPRRWFLSGNDGSLNAARLQLAAAFRRLPVAFDLADYATWPEQQTLDRIREIESAPAVLIVSEPVYHDAWSQFFVRRSSLVRAHLSEFRLLEANAAFALYSTPHEYAALQSLVPAPEINFGNSLLMEAGETKDHTLIAKLKLLKPLPCSMKAFIHAFPDKGGMRIWDQKAEPPFCQWTVGEEKTTTFQLPPEYVHDTYRVELGFFDEADAAHSWPPLPLTTGGAAVCFAPASHKTELPVRPCRTGWQ